MKDDERAALLALFRSHDRRPYSDRRLLADETVNFVHPKRLGYLLEKWTDKGWWDYGVSARTGWFTPEGVQVLAAMEETEAARAAVHDGWRRLAMEEVQ